MSAKRPSKKTTVKSPTPIRKSPFGTKATGAHSAIANPPKRFTTNGQ
jgi:hypothetical protein